MNVKYRNGNVNVSIDTNTGTKIRDWEGSQLVEFPESLDVKITNYCDLGCPYCHEMSDKRGEHSNLDELFSKISCLPKGIELAIGGGNPLSHPELPGFLRRCKSHGYISNITINQKHLEDSNYFYMIRDLLRRELVTGLGISFDKNTSTENIGYLQKYTDNIVIHVICGVHNIMDIHKLYDLQYKKILVLGYKSVGRGKEYEINNDVKLVIDEWYKKINEVISEVDCISFDNLSIDQLKVKRLFTDDKWRELYQGDDFTISMYVDAVNKEFAPTSRSNKEDRVSWNSIDLISYFKSNHVKEHN